MGYAASGMGNHELDFGREQFDKLRDIGGFPYLSANVRPPSKKSDKDYDLKLKPFAIFRAGRGEDRRGRAVGLQRGEDGDVRAGSTGTRSSPTSLRSSRPSRRCARPARTWSSSSPTSVRPCSSRSWRSTRTGSSPSSPEATATPRWSGRSGTTPLVSPGRWWQRYLRAELTVDSARPAGQRLVGLETKVVDVVGGSGRAGSGWELTARLQTWQQKHDEALGEKIGYTRSGIDANSATLFTWYGRAIRERMRSGPHGAEPEGLPRWSAARPDHRRRGLQRDALRQLGDDGEGQGEGPALDPGESRRGLRRAPRRRGAPGP